MADASRRLEITVFVTPQELRAWANKIERLWPRLSPGETTFIDCAIGSDFQVNIHLDQVRMRKTHGEPGEDQQPGGGA